MRTLDEMIYAMSPIGDWVSVDLASTDYTTTSTYKVKGIIAQDGTVIKVDKKNADGSTVTGYLPAPCWSPVSGLTKIYKTGTDSTKIILVIE